MKLKPLLEKSATTLLNSLKIVYKLTPMFLLGTLLAFNYVQYHQLQAYRYDFREYKKDMRAKLALKFEDLFLVNMSTRSLAQRSMDLTRLSLRISDQNALKLRDLHVGNAVEVQVIHEVK